MGFRVWASRFGFGFSWGLGFINPRRYRAILLCHVGRHVYPTALNP